MTAVWRGFPPVVTGDFNAWPDSDEVRRFGGRPVDGVWPTDHAAVLADLKVLSRGARPPRPSPWTSR